MHAKSKFDKRLLGTWKSDRERTFARYKKPQGVTAASHRKFQALFGSMFIEWKRGTYEADLDGTKFNGSYEVLGYDSVCVVIRAWDSIFEEHRLHQLVFHFEADGQIEGYRILAHGMPEYFRRLKKTSAVQ